MLYSLPHNFRNELAYCRDFDEAFDLYKETMAEMGFPFVSYSFCGWQTLPRLSDETWFRSSFPSGLNRAYINNRAIDHDLSWETMQRSTVKNGLRTYQYPDSIIYIDMMYRAAQFNLITDTTIELMDIAAGEKVFNGFCIGLPTKHPSFAASGVIAPYWMESEQLRAFMTDFGHIVLDIIFDFHTFCTHFQFPGPGQELTRKQQRVALTISQDKTLQQCADEMHMNDDSLYKLLERMRKKLFVNTNVGLITKLQLQRQI